MSKIKKGDVIKYIGARGYEFFTGCEYTVEKLIPRDSFTSTVTRGTR